MTEEIDEVEETDLLEWDEDAHKMFNHLRQAALLGDWKDMVSRAIELASGTMLLDDDEDPDYAALVEHIEVQCLYKMAERSQFFPRREQPRFNRPGPVVKPLSNTRRRRDG